MRLTPAFSGYLDFLRFFAALAVVLGHMMQRGYDVAWIPLSHFQHEAVIVFFVMSGLIITAVTTQGRRTWRDYAVARLARIYSVAMPALLTSIALSLVLVKTAPDFALGLPGFQQPSLVDFGLSAVFLSESWWPSLGRLHEVSLNGPYWSLCYEVWYYVLFGAFFFVQSAWRWPLLAGLAVIAGPAVMVMFPIWCMGAWLGARADRGDAFGTLKTWGLWVAPAVLVLIVATDLDGMVRDHLKQAIPAWWHLRYSQRVVTDVLLGALVAWHLWSFQHGPAWLQARFAAGAAHWARWAGFSFTLYLFHMPLVTIAGSLTPSAWKGPLASVAWAALFVGLCWLISLGTERQLPRWRRAFARLLSPPKTAEVRG